jgi:hypothetical protein
MSLKTGRAFLVGFIWFFGLYYYIEVRRLPDPSERMTISAVFWVFTLFTAFELFALFRARIAPPLKMPAGERFRVIVKDRRAQVFVLIILYLVTIPVIGFFTASFIAFAAFSFALGTRGFWKIFLPGILVLFSIYLIFSVMLKLTLPSGILP